ncbi:hypothetical protein N7512_005584 [Penicillium capsulatum]|nr:hypothetical protein N7512_005584 [Penicillium capsulatum]
MYPILCKVRFKSLYHVFKTPQIWVQIAFSIVAFLPDEPELRQGLILVGLAQCIAMTGLAGGDNEYYAILVAVNSLLQMVLFAPMVVFFIQVIGGDSHSLSIFHRREKRRRLPRHSARSSNLHTLHSPLGDKSAMSLIRLLFTILVLFASQGRHIVHYIISVIRVATPLIVYFAVIFFLTLLVTYKLGFGYKLAATQSFTAASNNFELAIAIAIATFGADSNQALASTIGPLIEVPVLLGLVHAMKWMARRLN